LKARARGWHVRRLVREEALLAATNSWATLACHSTAKAIIRTRQT
jgi:hypothetical protein